jgi:hypothetical protein
MLHEMKLGYKPRISFPFPTDPMTPDQYYGMLRSHDLQPGRKLMLAVLDNALESFQKHLVASTPRGKRLFQETEDWFLEQNSRWAFSFENICECLDLNAESLRKHLLWWKERTEPQTGASRPLRTSKRPQKRTARAAA